MAAGGCWLVLALGRGERGGWRLWGMLTSWGKTTSGKRGPFGGWFFGEDALGESGAVVPRRKAGLLGGGSRRPRWDGRRDFLGMERWAPGKCWL